MINVVDVERIQDGSDFVAEAGDVVGAVVDTVVEMVPAYDRIGYAGTTEPVEVAVVERGGFDPIAQGV